MLSKVFVFESDAAFAGELRSEFGHLGCTTTVVDDGNVGLQQAIAEKPDLILLSIELPRVNGFSVCNKLKKDPGLKDVPLIIMSSESSDDTFEQHKKLRTRAEDYVHKPIAFGELLDHIRHFVEVGGQVSDPQGAIVIEDEFEVGSEDYLVEEDGAGAPDERAAVGPAGHRIDVLDDDVDAFTESAFGRLTELESPVSAVPARVNHNGAGTSEVAAVASPRESFLPPPSRISSLRPQPSELDVLEHERTKNELAVTRERLEESERNLDNANREMSRLRLEVGDSMQLMREIDDLRTKIATPPKAAGTSSRDFLDLREGLNKKDKEILAFREQLSKKDREIVEAEDRALALERARADVEERLLRIERELAEVRDGNEVLASEREAAKKTAEDFRARFERAKAEGDAKDRQVAELRARQVDERTASDAKLAAVRAEADQVIANERAESARALDLAVQRRGADVEQARRERDAALVEAQKQADREKTEALAAQGAEARQERELEVAATRRGHLQELERARGEAIHHQQVAVEALRKALAEETRVVLEDRDSRIVSLEAAAARERSEALDRIAQWEAELSAARSDYRSAIDARSAADAGYEARIVELSRRLSTAESGRDELQRLGDIAGARITALTAEVEGLRRELAETNERLAAEGATNARARAKAESDRQSLELAKDALAVVLARIEDTEGDRTDPSI